MEQHNLPDDRALAEAARAAPDIQRHPLASLAVAPGLGTSATRGDDHGATPAGQPLPGRRAVETLDMSVIAQLRELEGDDDPNLLAELRDMLLAEAESGLSTMRAAIAHGDALTLARASHRLKGSGSALGAMAFAGVCAELERQAKATAFARAATLVDALADELERVRQALHALGGRGTIGSL